MKKYIVLLLISACSNFVIADTLQLEGKKIPLQDRNIYILADDAGSCKTFYLPGSSPSADQQHCISKDQYDSICKSKPEVMQYALLAANIYADNFSKRNIAEELIKNDQYGYSVKLKSSGACLLTIKAEGILNGNSETVMIHALATSFKVLNGKPAILEIKADR